MDDHRYYFEVGSDKDVNGLIKWWNDRLFEYENGTWVERIRKDNKND